MPEKSFISKNKVIFAALVVAVVAGTLIPLAIMGKLTVTSEQIFSFGEWLFTVFVAGHSAQRATGYIAQAVAATKASGVNAPSASVDISVNSSEAAKEEEEEVPQ